MDAMSRVGQLVGRIALGVIFILSGFGKVTNWSGTAAYAGSKGVSAGLLAVATALELLGGISVVLGLKARWGAVALLVFLVPVTLVFHNFWAVPPEQQQMEMVNFLKNLSIAGGLLIVLARGAGAYSFDDRSARPAGEPLAATPTR
jgi:putative oxidoreductase